MPARRSVGNAGSSGTYAPPALRMPSSATIMSSERSAGLGVAEERQQGDALIGMAHDRLEQGAIVSAQAPDRRGLEQIGVVLDHAFEAILRLGEEQCQVELRRARLQLPVAGHLRYL